MLWKDFIMNTPVKFITTATSGLNPVEDKLFAVTVGDVEGEFRSYFRLVDYADIAGSEDYHKIGKDLLLTAGKIDSVFIQALKEEVYGYVLLSYNKQFQESFLDALIPGIKVYDLPDLVRFAQADWEVDSEDTLDDVYAKIAARKIHTRGFSGLCRAEGIQIATGRKASLQRKLH